MERYAWKAELRPGMLECYRSRHQNLWPEMKEMLHEAGIHNYTIWTDGKLLFGYYECEYGTEYAAQVQAKSPIGAKWEAFMQDVMVMEPDPETNAQPHLENVFILE